MGRPAPLVPCPWVVSQTWASRSSAVPIVARSVPGCVLAISPLTSVTRTSIWACGEGLTLRGDQRGDPAAQRVGLRRGLEEPRDAAAAASPHLVEGDREVVTHRVRVGHLVEIDQADVGHGEEKFPIAEPVEPRPRAPRPAGEVGIGARGARREVAEHQG